MLVETCVLECKMSPSASFVELRGIICLCDVEDDGDVGVGDCDFPDD